MLRVLFVTNIWPTADEPWYGVFVRDQAEGLKELGVDLSVLSFDGRPDWRNYLRAGRELRKILSAQRFDLVHAHYGLTGSIAVVQRKLPTVTTFHGSDYTGETWWQKPISWVVARLSHPIFVSDEGPRLLGLPGADVIPEPVDTRLFVPMDRGEARRRLGWSDDEPYALLPGNRALKNKGPELFDAAVAEARKQIPGLQSASLQGISREQVALVMNAVDVAVMTSTKEGSPVAVREALACRTPVVSVDVGDVARLVEGLPGCRICPREPGALAAGIVAALEAGRPEELRARAEQFSPVRVAEQIVGAYERVLAARRAP